MSGMTAKELAERASVDEAFVKRLLELGILPPDDDTFGEGAVRTARFVSGLERGGLRLEAVAKAVGTGALSFRFFDVPYWDRFGGTNALTYRQIADESEVPIELLFAVREATGYARPDADERVRDDELQVLPLLRALVAMGIQPGPIERYVRVWGDSLRRIGDADSQFWRSHVQEPLLSAGSSWSEVLRQTSETSGEMVTSIDPALLAIYHAQSEHAWMRTTVETIERILEEQGLYHPADETPAMCFLDISGYTRLTEERGDDVAAETASALWTAVQASSLRWRGVPVKWVGDGVMVYFARPRDAVAFALDMREVTPATNLPPIHAGIAAGPVVFQDGDYFGRTVNLAARIAARAAPGQILVDDETARRATGQEVEFVDVGQAEMHGVPRPVHMFEARRGAIE